MIEKESVKLECLPLEPPLSCAGSSVGDICATKIFFLAWHELFTFSLRADYMLRVWQQEVTARSNWSVWLSCSGRRTWWFEVLRRSEWCFSLQSRLFEVLQVGPSEMQLACTVQLLSHGRFYFSKLWCTALRLGAGKHYKMLLSVYCCCNLMGFLFLQVKRWF